MNKRRSLWIFAAAVAIALSASLMSQSSSTPKSFPSPTHLTSVHGGIVAPPMNISWQTLLMAAR